MNSHVLWKLIRVLWKLIRVLWKLIRALFRSKKNCVAICRASLLYEMGYPIRSTVFVPMEF